MTCIVAALSERAGLDANDIACDVNSRPATSAPDRESQINEHPAMPLTSRVSLVPLVSRRRASLTPVSGGLRCAAVRESFLPKIQSIGDLPANPSRFLFRSSGRIRDAIFRRTLAWESRNDALPWGASETSSRRSCSVRERHTEEVLRRYRMFGRCRRSICDLSAGADIRRSQPPPLSPVFHAIFPSRRCTTQRQSYSLGLGETW